MRHMRALAFVGGWAHPAAQTGPPLATAMASLGVACEVVESFERATGELQSLAVDLLVIHACRFQMLDARYSPDQRAVHASITPIDFRQAVVAHLADGRPMLALHTASLCFDDWPAWKNLVGAAWSWERSSHPPPAPFVVTPTADPGVDDVHRFEVVDELYRFVIPADSARVVATATDDQAIAHPIAWLHDSGPSRVAYDALGHDHRSLANAGHRALLGRMVEWLVEQ
jgi:uncharacterized protein